MSRSSLHQNSESYVEKYNGNLLITNSGKRDSVHKLFDCTYTNENECICMCMYVCVCVLTRFHIRRLIHTGRLCLRSLLKYLDLCYLVSNTPWTCTELSHMQQFQYRSMSSV